jgi:cysteine desulfurase family protein
VNEDFVFLLKKGVDFVIYLDNASTTFPKPEKVYTEMNKCLREYCANPGRGGHMISRTAGQAVLKTREIISKFFNYTNPIQLCFTKNATEALNFAIKGVLRPGDHVITTTMEHNSIIRPLKTLEKDMGVEVSFIQGDEYGEVDPDVIKKNIKKNTRLIACTVSSNVNGIVMPITKIGQIAKEYDILFLVDASQGAGTFDIDVAFMNIDLLAFPGHKGLLGPQGSGGLYMREGLKIKPLIQGGTGSHSENLYQPDMMPELMESGTLNTPGIIGLGQGIEFINNYGLKKLKLFKHDLLKRLHEGLADIDGITIYSKNDKIKNSGIVAFNIQDIEPTEVSRILDKNYDIASRAGLHCAPLVYKTIGAPATGVVRLSAGCFNTIEEIDITITALQEITMKNCTKKKLA